MALKLGQKDKGQGQRDGNGWALFAHSEGCLPVNNSYLVYTRIQFIPTCIHTCDRRLLLLLCCSGADVPGQVVLDHSTIVFDGTKIAVLIAVIIGCVIILALICFQFADWFK